MSSPPFFFLYKYQFHIEGFDMIHNSMSGVCWCICLLTMCTANRNDESVKKNVFPNLRYKGLSFKVDYPSPLLFGVISSHCWVGWLEKLIILNRALSLEVALRARWILDILLMEPVPKGIRVFFQRGLSAVINIMSTYCPLCYQKMWTI